LSSGFSIRSEAAGARRREAAPGRLTASVLLRDLQMREDLLAVLLLVGRLHRGTGFRSARLTLIESGSWLRPSSRVTLRRIHRHYCLRPSWRAASARHHRPHDEGTERQSPSASQTGLHLHPSPVWCVCGQHWTVSAHHPIVASHCQHMEPDFPAWRLVGSGYRSIARCREALCVTPPCKVAGVARTAGVGGPSGRSA
jgi:hypothetical protein